MRELKLVPSTLDQIKAAVAQDFRTNWKSIRDLENRYGLSRDVIVGLQKIHDPHKKRKGIVRIPRARRPADVTSPQLAVPAMPGAPVVRRLIGLGCLIVAVALGVANGVMNVRFGVSFGQDDVSRILLGMVTISIDAGALLLFAASAYLSGGLCLAARGIWLICVLLSTIAALGFNSTNMGDSLQSRDKVVQHRRDLEQAKKLAETARAAITETGDPALLDSEMQRAQALVPYKNWKSSNECTSPSISVDFCREYNRLKDAKANAEIRIGLDAKLQTINQSLKDLPAISSKDPLADQISEMLWGLITPEQARSYLVRCLAIIPGFASILLAIARSLLW